MVTLYHCPGSRALRCLWALEEMGAPYELVVMPFPPRESTPDYLRINPLGTVPYLADGSVAMTESAAILEYLCHRYDARALRIDPGEAEFAEWLNWLHYGEATLTAPLAAMVRYAMTLPEAQRDARVVEDFAGVFLQRLERLEQALDGREFLVGGRFTVADISVGYALHLATFLGLGKRLPPAVSAYLASLKSRPAFKSARAKESAGT